MISSAFLLNKNHHSFIQTGTGKLAFTNMNIAWIVVGFITLAFGVLRIDLTQNYIDDWRILNERGVVYTFEVINTNTNRQFLNTNTTEVTFTGTIDNVNFTATRSTSDYTAVSRDGITVVEVVVDPQHMQRMALASNRGFPWGEVALTLAFIAVGTAFMLYGIYKTYQQQRLFRNGELITGEITEVIPFRSSDGLIYNIQYSFASPHTGNAITGTGKHIRTKLENRKLPQEGMPVAILYLDDKHHEAL